MIWNGDSWFLCRYPWQCLQQSFVKVATRSGTWLCGCPSFWASQSPSSPTSMTITSEMSFCPSITEDWNFVCIRVKNFEKKINIFLDVPYKLQMKHEELEMISLCLKNIIWMWDYLVFQKHKEVDCKSDFDYFVMLKFWVSDFNVIVDCFVQ